MIDEDFTHDPKFRTQFGTESDTLVEALHYAKLMGCYTYFYYEAFDAAVLTTLFLSLAVYFGGAE